MSSTLILVEASSREAGPYYCMVQNSLNELYKMVESAPVNVTVTGKFNLTVLSVHASIIPRE